MRYKASYPSPSREEETASRHCDLGAGRGKQSSAVQAAPDCRATLAMTKQEGLLQKSLSYRTGTMIITPMAKTKALDKTRHFLRLSHPKLILF